MKLLQGPRLLAEDCVTGARATDPILRAAEFSWILGASPTVQEPGVNLTDHTQRHGQRFQPL